MNNSLTDCAKHYLNHYGIDNTIYITKDDGHAYTYSININTSVRLELPIFNHKEVVNTTVDTLHDAWGAKLKKSNWFAEETSELTKKIEELNLLVAKQNIELERLKEFEAYVKVKKSLRGLK